MLAVNQRAAWSEGFPGKENVVSGIKVSAVTDKDEGRHYLLIFQLKNIKIITK